MTGARIALDALADAIERGATLLVPNHRLRDAILHTLNMQQPVTVFRTPPVFAIDVWLQHTWDELASLGLEEFANHRILSSHEEQLLWTQVLRQSESSYPLLDLDATAREVSQAYQLQHQWQLERTGSEALHQYRGIPDVAAFLDWTREFEEYCAQRGAISLTAATERLARSLPVDPDLLDREYLLVNFYQAPPLYQALFERLPGVCSAFTIATQATDARECLALATPQAELLACTRWIAERLASQPNAHIGVVCEDRQARQSAFARALADALSPESLFDFTSERVLFNSVGSVSSLPELGLIADGLGLLGLSAESQSSEALCRLLKSPYLLDAAEESEARLQMELLMRRRFSQRCSMTEFLQFLSMAEQPWHGPRLASALLDLRTRARRLPAMASAHYWRDWFETVLALLGWPGGSLSRTELAVYRQWQQTLQQYAAAAPLLGPMDSTTALERFTQLCELTPQSRESGIERQVSFYTANEALGLQFDHLWLLGCDDQSWPASAEPSPFLPYALQRDAGIPGSHSELRYAESERVLQWLARSVRGELVASYFVSDSDQEFRPSSLLQDWPKHSPNETVPPALNAIALTERSGFTLETVLDAPNATLPRSHTIQGGQQVISDQSACPFKAFARHRLRIEKLAEFSIGLTPSERGTAIHKALEILFTSCSSSDELQTLDTPARAELVEAAVSVALDTLSRRRRQLFTPRFRAIEQHRIESLLQQFLALEMQRPPFVVQAREREVDWRHRHLRLTLKLDRIDRLDDGTLAIIDYKTGALPTARSAWLAERSEDMQLPLYSVAADSLEEGELSAMALAQINAAKIDYSGFAAAANFHRRLTPVESDRQVNLQWPELRSNFHARVTAIASEFIEGPLRLSPANGPITCARCHRQSLCRIDETAQVFGVTAVAMGRD